MLKKKNTSFFLTNERLLILIGSDALAYARNIPEDTFLPFYEASSIPPFKCEVILSGIKNVYTQQELLTV